MIWNILTWSRLDNFGCWVRAQLEKSATSLASALMATNLNWSGLSTSCAGLQRAPITFVQVQGAWSADQGPGAENDHYGQCYWTRQSRCHSHPQGAFSWTDYKVVKDHSKVDAEDLPSNMEGMEREELQCVAASYGVDFDDKADVKVLGHITHITLLKDDWG